MQSDLKRRTASKWFSDLRDQICNEFELIEQQATINNYMDAGKFERKNWEREQGGGGVMSVMRGRVFEKVGVNISTVFGELSKDMQKQIPGAEENPNFFATGISLVAHMNSPHVPAVHMNTRYIVTTKEWFGGGADLTPIFTNEAAKTDFHNSFKAACNKHDETYYPKFSKWCDEYFYLPHRNEPRGIGGIFYDYLNTNNWENDFNFTQDIGKAFLAIYPQIVRNNMHKTWTKEEREQQLIKRGRYVEFNLLYDRGTKFGLMTNGNTEAILMSLPPEVKW
jgi:coproporphyrinogen III oxidase